MRRKLAAISVFIALCIFSSSAWSQQGNNNPNGKPPDVGTVTNMLKSNDNFQVQQGIELGIRMLNDEKNNKSASDEILTWLKTLLQQKRLEEVEEMAWAGICSQPTALPMVESCQRYRVRASLVANKPKDALALAKGLYNVCSMSTTGQAIDLVSECVYDANKDDDPAGKVTLYKKQQIRGAALPTPGQPASAEKLTLADIQVDPKPYQKAIENAELNADGFAGLMGKGNLLLLADQPKEARKAFDKAYTLAADKFLAPASEAVARSMRAEDGTVGRANAWILSLRPQDGGQ